MPVTNSFSASTKAKSSEVNANFNYLTDIVDVSGGVNVLKTTAKARAYRGGSTQAIANTTATKVQLNTESYDLGANFDVSSNFRFTAPVTGYYLIVGAVRFADGFDADRRLVAMIYKNGAAAIECEFQTSTAQIPSATVHDIMSLAATDYVELWTYQESGATHNLQFTTRETFMAVHLLSTD